MSQEATKRDFLFDNRIYQRHIRQDLLKRDEFEQYLASLPDLKDACDDIGEEIYGVERTAAVTGEYSREEDDDA